MRSTVDRPRNQSGRFVPLITDKQLVHLQDLVRSSRVSTGHRINVRLGLKAFVTREEGSREISRLHRVVRA